MGLKRRQVTVVRRLKAGWRAGLSVAIVESGLFSPFLSGVGQTGLGLYGAVIAATSLAAAFLQGKSRHLPPHIIEEISKENHYTVRLCGHENLRRSCDETESLFGREAVDFETLEQWRLAFPEGFIELINNSGEFCGCFIFMALTNSFTEEFLSGRHTEQQICPGVILEIANLKKAKNIYICGIMVVDPRTQVGAKRAAVLVSASIRYVRKILGSGKRRFYTVPITKDGQSLVTKLGFKATGHPNTRSDKHSLYTLELSGPQYGILQNQLGDYSPLVDINI